MSELDDVMKELIEAEPDEAVDEAAAAAESRKKRRKIIIGASILGGIFLVFFIAALVSVISSATGGNNTVKKYASAKAISVGTQAIDLADEYLDGADYYTVKAKLEDLEDEMDYVDDMPTDTTEEKRVHTADRSIQLSIFLISTDITLDYCSDDNETYDSIIESRNELAKDLGLDER